jgi:hypothetical protein
MALSDIITTPFLICLAITSLLVIGLAIFFIQKINYQNHKINSMFDLVTTMAEEINGVKARVIMITNPINNSNQTQSTTIIPHFEQHGSGSKNELIEVSDEDNDDNDDNDDEESLNDVMNLQSDEDEEEDDEEDEDEDEDDEEDEENVKHITISNMELDVDDLENDMEELESDEDCDDDIESVASINSGDDDCESVDEIQSQIILTQEEQEQEIGSDINISNEQELQLESQIKLEETNAVEESKEIDNLDILKTINIAGLEDSEEKHEVQDYKRLPLNKLKTIAIEKGLINDSSKLKKNEILKLLGAE